MLSLELARRVGPAGAVHAIDIDATFLERARSNAEAERVSDWIEFHRIEKDALLLEDESVDRIVCKNVLDLEAPPGARGMERRGDCYAEPKPAVRWISQNAATQPIA